MKKGIHPNWHSDVKVVFNGKEIMTVGSTSPELSVEIWAGNHPFYTGKQTLVDTDNLVERFNKKIEMAQKGGVSTKARKRAKRVQKKKASNFSTKEVTLKDMLKDFK